MTIFFLIVLLIIIGGYPMIKCLSSSLIIGFAIGLSGCAIILSGVCLSYIFLDFESTIIAFVIVSGVTIGLLSLFILYNFLRCSCE